jgi:hypothetical protein
MLWVLGLWGAVLPATILLVLVARLAEHLEAGVGAATAVILGAGTLLLPFASLFHAHVLAATLLFASFALLWLRRGLAAGAVAGALAGYAVSTEYSSALAVVILGAYACRLPLRGRRVCAYAAGVLAGLVPLGLYNLLAFGSPFELSYSGADPTNRASTSELLGGLHFDVFVLLETLFSMTGLLVLAPVLACGIPGLILLYRRAFRAEALVLGAVVAVFVLYNASLGTEFDAYSGGQRYLIVALAFLVLPVALVLRKLPLTVGALTLISTLFAAGLAAGHVRTGQDPRWFRQVLDHGFPASASSFVGVTGWYAFLPYFALLGCAVGASFAAARLRPTTRESLNAAIAVLAWAAAAALAPNTAAGATTARDYDHLLPIGILAAGALLWSRKVTLVGEGAVDTVEAQP